MNFYEFFPSLPKLPNALCRDYEFPDLFFPTSQAQEAKSLGLAQAICAGCEHRKECLEYALSEEIPYGIWAGTTPEMRAVTIEARKVKEREGHAREIRKLHRKGRTQHEIARSLEVDPHYVTKVIRQMVKLEGENQSQPIAKPGEESPSSSGFPQ